MLLFYEDLLGEALNRDLHPVKIAFTACCAKTCQFGNATTTTAQDYNLLKKKLWINKNLLENIPQILRYKMTLTAFRCINICNFSNFEFALLVTLCRDSLRSPTKEQDNTLTSKLTAQLAGPASRRAALINRRLLLIGKAAPCPPRPRRPHHWSAPLLNESCVLVGGAARGSAATRARAGARIRRCSVDPGAEGWLQLAWLGCLRLCEWMRLMLLCCTWKEEHMGEDEGEEEAVGPGCLAGSRRGLHIGRRSHIIRWSECGGCCACKHRALTCVARLAASFLFVFVFTVRAEVDWHDGLRAVKSPCYPL